MILKRILKNCYYDEKFSGDSFGYLYNYLKIEKRQEEMVALDSRRRVIQDYDE